MDKIVLHFITKTRLEIQAVRERYLAVKKEKFAAGLHTKEKDIIYDREE